MSMHVLRGMVLVVWLLLMVLHFLPERRGAVSVGFTTAVAAQAGRSSTYVMLWRGATVATIHQDLGSEAGVVTIDHRVNVDGELPLIPLGHVNANVTMRQTFDHQLSIRKLDIKGSLMGVPISASMAIDHLGLRANASFSQHVWQGETRELTAAVVRGCAMLTALPPDAQVGDRLELPMLVPDPSSSQLVTRRIQSIQVTSQEGQVMIAVQRGGNEPGQSASTLRFLPDGAILSQYWPDLELTLTLVRLSLADGTRLAP